MTGALFLFGAAAAVLFKVRRWPLVTIAGGVAALALEQALWRIAPDPIDYGIDRRVLGGVHLVSATAGFAAAAWALATSRRWWSKVAAPAALAAVCALTIPLAEPARRWHMARGFELVGVPLVGPDIAGYQLFHAEPPSPGSWGEPVIMLDYRRAGAETDVALGIQVEIRRASAATPAAACATAEYAGAATDSCRAVTGGLWVRHDWLGQTTVFTHGNGALVRLESRAAEETVVLAAARSIRPISAEAVAERVHQPS